LLVLDGVLWMWDDVWEFRGYVGLEYFDGRRWEILGGVW
jgi:hypothetical protein